jgi:3-hydroxybutyryl-CoA dehydrogenase
MSVEPRTAVIVGGGSMGCDIAVSFAAGGWRVHVVEPGEAARASLAARAARGLDSVGAPGEAAARIEARSAVEGLGAAPVDLAVECVPEELALKRRVFAELEAALAPGTPLVSNTSSFPIGAIAQDLADASRTAGLHYFLPAHLVPLVEVVRGPETTQALMDYLVATMESLGKVPVRVERDVPGFLANRLQHALMREAYSLIGEGIATPADVDAAVRFGFGLRYVAAGPIRQKDLAGLDVHLNAARTIYPTLCNDAEPSRLVEQKVAAGDLGVKGATGRGFYEWDEASARAFRARYDTLLEGALALIRDDLPNAERAD